MAGKITKLQMQAMQLMVEGQPIDDIAITLFDCRSQDGFGLDEKKLAKARSTLRKWNKDPALNDYWKDLLITSLKPEFVRALRRVSEQVDDPNGWLANKAANDILTRFSPAILGSEDKSVTVRIEGAPTLGVPDAPEALPDA